MEWYYFIRDYVMMRKAKGIPLNKGNLSIDEFMLLRDYCETDNPIGEKTYPDDLVYEGLEKKGYVFKGRITEAGRDALEPYRAKRAIFMAAGFGSRLAPITINTPKPLVRVHGCRIIDTLIDACLNAGIEEIWVIRGYLGEQFDVLTSKYPMVRFIDNPYYKEANNISSMLMARSLLKNAYVLEADLLLYNPSIIKQYHYSSEFLSIPVKQTDDWCFIVEDGVISEQKIGGSDCEQMVGISYWDSVDGEHLEQDLESAFNMSGGKNLYWEQVPLKVFNDCYRIGVCQCSSDDVIEIDSYDELKAIDSAYCIE